MEEMAGVKRGSAPAPFSQLDSQLLLTAAASFNSEDAEDPGDGSPTSHLTLLKSGI